MVVQKRMESDMWKKIKTFIGEAGLLTTKEVVASVKDKIEDFKIQLVLTRLVNIEKAVINLSNVIKQLVEMQKVTNESLEYITLCVEELAHGFDEEDMETMNTKDTEEISQIIEQHKKKVN